MFRSSVELFLMKSLRIAIFIKDPAWSRIFSGYPEQLIVGIQLRSLNVLEENPYLHGVWSVKNLDGEFKK